VFIRLSQPQIQGITLKFKSQYQGQFQIPNFTGPGIVFHIILTKNKTSIEGLQNLSDHSTAASS
jgi:hypothetical protein